MPDAWLDRVLMSQIQRLVGSAPVQLAWGVPPASVMARPSPAPTIWIKDRKTLLALLRNPHVNFGDLYGSGAIEIEGDLARLIETIYRIPESGVGRLSSQWTAWLQGNSLRSSRRNIRHHYDISNDFYRLWLDPQMIYTCAYFPKEDSTLAQAQNAKLDLVCRKLWLKPGESVVEAGCGWGALALHMAAHYGVKVRAFNISSEQIAFARERARREGLSSEVEFIEDDYRNIHGRYDAFASIGMLEHVGKKNHAELARVIGRTIGDHGRALLHFIGRNRPRKLNTWIRRRIFPGAYPPTLREVTAMLEPHDFNVLDVENLRTHYARTLEWWLSAFEENFDKVAAMFDRSFARMWRLYLAGSTAAFRCGSLQLFQVVFAGCKCKSMPATRAHLYQTADDSQEQSCVPAMS